ncbi:MAG: anti-sigma factor [Chitinophagales bacterium]|nr:anti-sigma factor [Chitinophagales bacterium]MDW8392882.1 anti-sigma factor [Chitinophagales bacterium]
MNAQELIESGLLESYCLGVLSLEEMRNIEALACQHQEVREELRRIQQSLETYAELHAVAPPESVRERLMARAFQSPAAQAKPIVRSLRPYWTAAAALVAVVMTATALALFMKQRQLERQLADLHQRNKELAEQHDALRQLSLTQSEQLALLSDLHTRRIQLTGTSKAPENLAVVYWNTVTHSVFLDVKNMPAPAADRQYQLWFITAEQKPVDAGVFDASSGLVRMKDARDAVAFAITLEPRGGSPQPTLDQMVVFGQVSG